MEGVTAEDRAEMHRVLAEPERVGTGAATSAAESVAQAGETAEAVRRGTDKATRDVAAAA